MAGASAGVNTVTKVVDAAAIANGATLRGQPDVSNCDEVTVSYYLTGAAGTWSHFALAENTLGGAWSTELPALRVLVNNADSANNYEATYDVGGLSSINVGLTNSTGSARTATVWVYCRAAVAGTVKLDASANTVKIDSAGNGVHLSGPGANVVQLDGAGGTQNVNVTNASAIPVHDATASSGTLALSADDSSRLDLTWWGVWAIVGVLFALMIAPLFVRTFRFWKVDA